MTPFFTRTGDDGTTGTLGDTRLPKEHPRMEALGSLDEASAALGLARAAVQADGLKPLLLEVQRDLYRMMAEVAATPENAARFRTIDETRVQWLEGQLTSFEGRTQVPKEFIIPGDTPGGAGLALARTVVRRAERRVSELLHAGDLENRALLSYLNRLSSLLFLLELFETQQAGPAGPTLARTDSTR